MPDDPTLLKKDFRSIHDALFADLRSSAGGRVALTDDNPGSVLRTLVESFSRELAVAYAQLDQVYRLGYLDTADGQALDNVVALLGIERRRGGRLQGTVTFSGAAPAVAAIEIPAGTVLSGNKQPAVVTTRAAAIERGQREVTVPVRSIDPSEVPVARGKIDTMARPLFGIDRVTNHVDLIPLAADESDEELRGRARAVVAGASTGTLAAIELAVRSLGLAEVSVTERPEQPGVIDVTVGDEELDDAALEDVRRAIERVRPAGIAVELSGVTWVDLAITATIELARDLVENERRALQRRLEDQIRSHIARLGVYESVRDAQIQSLLVADDAVAGARKTMTPFVGDTPNIARKRTNGDVLIGPRERVRLRPDPPDLTLEAPQPLVQVDVDLLFRKTLPEVAGLREKLVAHLRELDEAKEPQVIDWAIVKRKLPQDAAGMHITVIHERDGRVAELVKNGDSDPIEPREIPVLRNLTARKATS